jgi:hypothetical protein
VAWSVEPEATKSAGWSESRSRSVTSSMIHHHHALIQGSSTLALQFKSTLATTSTTTSSKIHPGRSGVASTRQPEEQPPGHWYQSLEVPVQYSVMLYSSVQYRTVSAGRSAAQAGPATGSER